MSHVIENVARVVEQFFIKRTPILVGCRVIKTEETTIGEVLDPSDEEFVQSKVTFEITFNAKPMYKAYLNSNSDYATFFENDH